MKVAVIVLASVYAFPSLCSGEDFFHDHDHDHDHDFDFDLDDEGIGGGDGGVDIPFPGDDFIGPVDDGIFFDNPSPASPDCFRDNELTTLFKFLSKGSTWTSVGHIHMDFVTYHTQGLYKIGEHFFVSAVEIIDRTERTGSTDALFDFSIDRTTGTGKAWLFKYDTNGHLVGQVDLTAGSVYHPGGIDYDGKHLWVPVAEYRPNSYSYIYTVDPNTLEATLVFDYPDHIGGVVHNTNTNTLHAVSWGSRRLYEFSVSFSWNGSVTSVGSFKDFAINPQKYIDYQDCHYFGIDYMICGGLNKYDTPVGQFAFGGLDLFDLQNQIVSHTVPVQAYIDEFGTGESPTLVASNNAYFMEVKDDTTMRMYFQTETADNAALWIYDVTRYESDTVDYPECTFATF